MPRKRISGNEVIVTYGPERLGDVKHSRASIKKAKDLLGYRPETMFEEGLIKTFKWYLEVYDKTR